MAEVSTERLRLRPFTMVDLEDHARIYSDPEVMRYMPRGPMTLAQARQASHDVLMQFICHWDERGFGVWAVVDSDTGTLLGQCGLRFLPELEEVEVLYLLAKTFWQRGLATEAARAALAYGFTQLTLDRIVALIKPENIASRRVLEKLGMRYEKDLRMFSIDTNYYALNRDLYDAAQL